MAKVIFNLYDAKAALSKLVDRAAKGEEIVIAKNGHPLVKLVAVARKEHWPGGGEGQVFIAEVFDVPLASEPAHAFEGRDDE